MSGSIDPSIPPFRYTLTASPDGEIWDHTDDTNKFQKFGWRTTTTENAYETKTRIGNWNERCFGIDEIQKKHQPKSQYGHYFESTQKVMTSAVKAPDYPDSIKYLLRKEATAFPCHQPELCSDYTNQLLSDMYKTNTSSNYCKHAISTPAEAKEEGEQS
ncbi:cilia- and flagella-associated protein 68-like [Bolinopsis microptera]|uniref:cilia- and flagella-associated protein 68-like n=1 Tax=Bolinopsis microptera TaxID=2820187 RepID=UPI00307A44A4